MNLADTLAPLLEAPGATAAAFLDPQGQAIAQVGDPEAVERLGAYQSVWMSDIRRAVAPGGLGDVTEVDLDFESGRILASMVREGYFVLVVFGPDGVPALARPKLTSVRRVLAAEVG